MSRSKNPWPWMRPLLILILVVSIPPLLYWFGYVQLRANGIRQQAHVTLSAVTTELKNRMDAQLRIARSVEKSLRPTASEKTQSPKQSGSSTDAKKKEGRIKGLESLLQSVLSSREVSVSQMQSNSQKRPPCSTDEDEESRYEACLDIDAAGGALALVFLPKDQASKSLKASIPLASLIAWDLVSSDFDGLLVVDSERRLVAQDRRLPQQPTGLPIPLKQPTQKEASQPVVATSWFNVFEFSHDKTLQLAGKDYLVFVQQLRIPAKVRIDGNSPQDQSGNAADLSIYALIRQDRVRQEAIALSPQTLLLFGSALLFILFAIPFIKLWFIGSRERLRRRDVWWLGFSLLGATGLCILLVLNIAARRELTDRLDRGLTQFSEQMRTRLQEEARLIDNSLRGKDGQKLIQRAQRNGHDFGLNSFLSKDDDLAFADFDSYFLTNLIGKQQYKWTSRTESTKPLSVDDREYFRRGVALSAEAPAFRSCYANDAPVPSNYYFEAVRAKTTGLLSGVFATPYSIAGDQPIVGLKAPTTERRGLLAVTTAMRPVNNVAVAEPFQFVLVDRHNLVSFYHAKGPYAGERFFDAVTGGAYLFDAARDASLDCAPSTPRAHQYRGRSYRLTTAYVPELDSIVVAYYDPAVISVIVTRSFGAAAIASFGILALIAAGAVLMMTYRGARAYDWIYPSPELTGVYFVGYIFFALAASWTLVAHRFLSAGALAWSLLALPLLVMIMLGSRTIAAAVQRLEPHLGPLRALRIAMLRTPLMTGLAFKTACTLTVATLVALPTIILFDDSLRLHAQAYAAQINEHWLQQQRRRDEELRGEYVQVDKQVTPAGCDRSQTASNTKQTIGCALPDFIYATSTNYAKLTSHWQSGVYTLCVDLLGESDCTLTPPSSIALTDEPSNAANCFLDLFPALSNRAGTSLTYCMGRFLVGANSAAEQSQFLARAQETLSSSSLLGWSRSSGSIWFLLFLICGSSFLLAGSIAKRVLAMSIVNAALPDFSSQFDLSQCRRWLLLRPNRATLDRIDPSATFFDLRDSKISPAVLETPSDSRTIVVLHLESQLENSEWRQALRNLLRSHAGCVVLTSDIDPFYYATRRAQELATNDAPMSVELAAQQRTDYLQARKEAFEWAWISQSIRKISGTNRPSALNHNGDGWPRTAALRTLFSECAVNESMASIGRQLLEIPDIVSRSEEQVIDMVLDLAEPYYRHQWELCSTEEKLVLSQLANEGLINPQTTALAQQLIRRGLIVAKGRLRLMNESFASFVRGAESQTLLKQWEHEATASPWSHIGAQLYTLAAVVIGILLFTQQEMLTNLLGTIAVAGGTVGQFRKAIVALKPDISGTRAA